MVNLIRVVLVIARHLLTCARPYRHHCLWCIVVCGRHRHRPYRYGWASLLPFLYRDRETRGQVVSIIFIRNGSNSFSLRLRIRTQIFLELLYQTLEKTINHVLWSFVTVNENINTSKTGKNILALSSENNEQKIKNK